MDLQRAAVGSAQPCSPVGIIILCYLDTEVWNVPSVCTLALFTLTIHSATQIFVESYMPEKARFCSLTVCYVIGAYFSRWGLIAQTLSTLCHWEEPVWGSATWVNLGGRLGGWRLTGDVDAHKKNMHLTYRHITGYSLPRSSLIWCACFLTAAQMSQAAAPLTLFSAFVCLSLCVSAAAQLPRC